MNERKHNIFRGLSRRTDIKEMIKNQYLNSSYKLPYWGGNQIYNNLGYISITKDDISKEICADKATVDVVCRMKAKENKTTVEVERNNILSQLMKNNNCSDIKCDDLQYNEDTLPMLQTTDVDGKLFAYVIPAKILENYFQQKPDTNRGYQLQMLLEYHKIDPSDMYIMLPNEDYIDELEDEKDLKMFKDILEYYIGISDRLGVNLCTE